ncbi:hypothetical protein SEA_FRODOSWAGGINS_8 [Streptomyces phage FrodoSwaggins]|uniref:Uncharacterized protein n=3 Tax=Rimavirus drgrey TaxID=2560783 RepID=A0A649VWA8_9CAUD|nr:hypothetical protein FDI43_gp08 [Streptomyces phage DrGrey]ASU03922.1 hypothetical protein SEA_DRGREY_8 [Streptomyces phage DrGrey]QAY17042.1 hypothetical protein SEA_POPY_8 [Streptomyces phage Popy]QGJ96548.1 hypothetical protein SEA_FRODOSWAGGINS_8 [Streptomyces phage FrodoSwaggins]
MSSLEDEVARILRHGELTADDILGRSLAHYGVKGMKWGVRKDEDGKGRDAATEKWKKAHKPKKQPSTEQGKKNLAANEKKSLAKLEGSDEPPKKKSFVARHKKALIFAGAIAGLYAANKVAEAKTIKSIEELRGKSIDANTFQKHVNHSKIKTWMTNDYIHESSWARDEFTLPAGHEFHRLSKKAESEFRDATYATHSPEDYHRYVAQFRQELGGNLHHVTFQANEDIRVPKLSTTLQALKDALVGDKKEFNAWYTDERVLAKYQELSGGSWDDSHAKGMFDNLRKKGYGAIVDEMDAGVIGETPLVIFARELVGKKSSEPLTKSDIDFAEASLIELENRKY